MQPVVHLYGFHANLVVIIGNLAGSSVKFDLCPLTGAFADSQQCVHTRTLPIQPECQAIKPHHMIGGAAHTHACPHGEETEY